MEAVSATAAASVQEARCRMTAFVLTIVVIVTTATDADVKIASTAIAVAASAATKSVAWPLTLCLNIMNDMLRIVFRSQLEGEIPEALAPDPPQFGPLHPHACLLWLTLPCQICSGGFLHHCL